MNIPPSKTVFRDQPIARRNCVAVGTHQKHKESTTRELALAFANWMDCQSYLKQTQHLYNGVVRDFCAFLWARPIQTVTPLDITDFLAITSAGPHPDHRYRSSLTALRCFFKFLYSCGAVDTLAPWFVKSLPRPFNLPRFLTEIQIRKLIAAAPSLRDKALIEFMYATGCRLGEIPPIKVEDIDFHQRKVLVCGKRRERYVYFGKAAHRAIRRYLGRRRDGFLFLDNRLQQKGFLKYSPAGWLASWIDYRVGRRRTQMIGASADTSRRVAVAKLRRFLSQKDLTRPRRRLGRNGIRSTLLMVGERAGIKNVAAGMFRHSFATHMLQRGADIRSIQQLLGHTTLKATHVYTYVSDSRTAEQFRRFHPRSI